MGWGIGATITSSYAVVGAVNGSDAVGGLVGGGEQAVTITSSYAVVGAVTGSDAGWRSGGGW